MSVQVIDKHHEDYQGVLERFSNVHPIYAIRNPVDDFDDLEDLLNKTGLDWSVVQCPVYYETDRMYPATGYIANVRSDNHVLLGVVGKRYHVFNNEQFLSYILYLADEFDLHVQYAYHIRGGKQVFVFCQFPSFVKMNDIEYWGKYLCFYTSHDGTKSITVIPMAVRLLNGGTYSLGMFNLLATKHTARCERTLRVFGSVLSQFESNFNDFMNHGHKLIERHYTHSDLAWFLNELFPPPKGGSKTANTRYENRLNTLHSIIRKLEVGTLRGTWWVLFNAVCAYVDFYVKGRGNHASENRLVSALTGDGSQLKQKALNLALSKITVDI